MAAPVQIGDRVVVLRGRLAGSRGTVTKTNTVDCSVLLRFTANSPAWIYESDVRVLTTSGVTGVAPTDSPTIWF